MGQIAGATQGIDVPSDSDDLLLNDGSGNFELAPVPLPPRSGGRSFGTVASEFVDLNGDGALDLVLSRVDDSQFAGAGIQLLLNEGSGSFVEASAGMTESFSQETFLAWVDPVDVDGDGVPELAVSAQFGERSLILRSTEDGSYVTHREHLDLVQAEYGRLFPGDLNGDGRVDLLLVTGGGQNSQLYILENTRVGAGSLAWIAHPALTVPLLTPDGELIDWDDDGDLDLIITELLWPPSVSGDGIRLYRNDGNFVFVEAHMGTLVNGPIAVEHPRDFVVADFNGDGASDMFIADHGLDQPPFLGTQNRLLIQESGGMREDSEARLGVRSGFTHGACAADVDNDGDIDLLSVDLNVKHESGVVLSLNDGSGVFSSVLVEVPSAAQQ